MCRKIIKGIIIIGFTIQIVLGLAWAGCNIVGIQDFAEVTTGLYGGIVQLFGGAYPILYVLQLLTAGYAGWRMVSRLCNCGRNKNLNAKSNMLFALWGSLALMTLPMAMQCHMALLPYSFACSAGLLQLSFCCELLEPAGNFRHGRFFRHIDFYENSENLGHREIFGPVPFMGIWICYFVQSLLLPEYVILGAVPVVAMLFWKRKGIARAKMRLKLFVILAVAFAGIFAICSQSERTENDISGVEWTLVKRLCWPTLWTDYEGMSEEIREATADVVWESAYYPSNMDRLFKPAIETAMDVGEARPLLSEMAVDSWRRHRPMIIRQIGWDALAYCASPVILQMQLSGDAYESHSGRNYEIMRRNAPVLTRQYVDYSGWWFAAAAVLTMVLLIARLAAGEKPYGGREARLAVTVFLFAACSIFWYTVQGAGIMDYKYTIFINELWILWSFKTMDV